MYWSNSPSCWRKHCEPLTSWRESIPRLTIACMNMSWLRVSACHNTCRSIRHNTSRSIRHNTRRSICHNVIECQIIDWLIGEWCHTLTLSLVTGQPSYNVWTLHRHPYKSYIRFNFSHPLPPWRDYSLSLSALFLLMEKAVHTRTCWQSRELVISMYCTISKNNPDLEPNSQTWVVPFSRKEDKTVRQPGIEPGSIAWKATMLTFTPPTLVVFQQNINFHLIPGFRRLQFVVLDTGWVLLMIENTGEIADALTPSPLVIRQYEHLTQAGQP